MYSTDNAFLSVIVGSMLNVVKSLAIIPFLIFTWMPSTTFPVFTFVIVSVLIKNPDVSSVEVIPFFSPRYKVPSIFSLPLFVWKIDSRT